MSSFLIAGAVIGGCIGGTQGLMGVRKYNRKINDRFWEQVRQINRQYSYAQNELDKQAVYARDDAQSEMYQLSLNAFRNNSLVESALSESGLEGRSQKAVARDVRGQSERQKDNIQASYENAIYSIKSNKDSLYTEYRDNIKDLRDSIKGSYKSGLNAIMEIGDKAAIGAFMGYVGAGAGSAAFSALGSSTGGSLGGVVSGGTAGMGSGTGLTIPASSLGSATTTGLTAGPSFVGLSAGNATLGSGASSAGLTVSPSLVNSWASGAMSSGFNWGQFSNEFMSYYNKANSYFSKYQRFRNTFDTAYGGTSRRRRIYY